MPRLTRRETLAVAGITSAGIRPAAAQARPGVLRYAITTMPNVIDPHFSAGFQVRDIAYAVFDIASGRTAMWGWQDDPEIERLRAAFARESDPARRADLATAIQRQVYPSVAYIPGGEVCTTSAAGDWVSGALHAPVVLF